MKNYYYPFFLATAIAATACSDDSDIVENVTPVEQKESIAFVVSDEGARLTPTTPNTRAGFAEDTHIVARFESFKNGGSLTDKRSTRTVLKAVKQGTKDYSDVSYLTTEHTRYWDDAYGRYGMISVYAVAVPGKTRDLENGSNTLESLVDYSGNNVSATYNVIWKTDLPSGTSPNNNIAWTVTTSAQTDGATGTIAAEDLCYSNNIQNGGKDGRYVYNFDDDEFPEFSYVANPTDGDHFPNFGDDYLRFSQKAGATTSDPGKFDKGHLIFKHALTRLTVHLKKGTGFVAANPFAFKTDTDIKLINVPVSGTLNIKTGEWLSSLPGNISKMAALSVTAGEAYRRYAQFVPGYKFRENANTASDNVMEFTIDDNTYYITQEMIFKALTTDTDGNAINADEKERDASGYYVEMKQGKNYDITITINKTEIKSITATLVDWVPVEGTNMEGSNSYVELSLMDKTSTACDHFDLWRVDAGFENIYTDQNGVDLPELTNWMGNYTDKATLTDKGSGVWSTNWYWESNKAFYHLRSIDKGMTIEESTGSSADANDDYINVYSGPINNTWGTGTPLVANLSTTVNDLKYNDYHWGAPMKAAVSPATDNLTYNTTTGYASYIHPAIGSTYSTINMIEQHMMANIHIVLHTGIKADETTDVSTGKITLKDASNKATRITLTNFKGAGKVYIGNGLVTADDVIISSDIPVPGLTPSYNAYDETNKLYSLSSIITSSTESDYYTKKSENEDVTVSYNYRVVPQPLYHGSGNAADDDDISNFIGLTLVSPDNNQYYMVKKLYLVTASSVTTNHGKTEQVNNAQITYWYPGYDYTYHIYLNKKDIEAITCTVADWVTVTGGNKDITLED